MRGAIWCPIVLKRNHENTEYSFCTFTNAEIGKGSTHSGILAFYCRAVVVPPNTWLENMFRICLGGTREALQMFFISSFSIILKTIIFLEFFIFNHCMYPKPLWVKCSQGRPWIVELNISRSFLWLYSSTTGDFPCPKLSFTLII